MRSGLCYSNIYAVIVNFEGNFPPPGKTMTSFGAEKVVELSREELLWFHWSVELIISAGDFVSRIHDMKWVIIDVEEFN